VAAEHPTAATDDALARARAIMDRCDHLATFSEEPDRLTRRYGTPALRAAQDAVADWMRAAGMDVRRDAIGNLIGRYAGQDRSAKTLLLGSHLDTVRDAGKYDGPLGILVALAAVERLHERNERLPFEVEIVAFADEEGLCFHTAFLGSHALVGTLDDATLQVTDADGITVADAIRAFGGEPGAVSTSQVDPTNLMGYVETHIEQGPVLDRLDLPVGVVSGIAGQTRARLRLVGAAGHAGTVPMALRRDALCAAADVVLAAESLARQTAGLVATVGQLDVDPGASNVVPGAASLSVDVRHEDDRVRHQAWDQLHASAAEIGASRGIETTWGLVEHTRSVPCDPILADLLAGAIADTGHAIHRLPSGAGHDAVSLAALTPVAMLFVRCAGGISHHRAESVSPDDVAVAIQVQDHLLRLLADDHVGLVRYGSVTERTAGMFQANRSPLSADAEREAAAQAWADDAIERKGS